MFRESKIALSHIRGQRKLSFGDHMSKVLDEALFSDEGNP